MTFSPKPLPTFLSGDGKRLMTVHDLPDQITRWTIRRKAELLNAIRAGAISRETVLQKYGISDQEFDSWKRSSEQGGMLALRVTMFQRMPRA